MNGGVPFVLRSTPDQQLKQLAIDPHSAADTSNKLRHKEPPFPVQGPKFADQKCKVQIRPPAVPESWGADVARFANPGSRDLGRRHAKHGRAGSAVASAGVVCWRSFIECIAGVQERRREFSLMTHNDRDSVPFSKILH